MLQSALYVCKNDIHIYDSAYNKWRDGQLIKFKICMVNYLNKNQNYEPQTKD